jgi:hypothetical protein
MRAAEQKSRPVVGCAAKQLLDDGAAAGNAVEEPIYRRPELVFAMLPWPRERAKEWASFEQAGRGSRHPSHSSRERCTLVKFRAFTVDFS